jgi:hypothetical protein
MTSKAICLASDVGDRFSPTNEEIINHFLRHKLLGNDHLVSKIPQLDIYQFDPWDLPCKQMDNLKYLSLFLL